MNQPQIQQVTRYLRVWLQAYQDTVELAAFAAEDVLAGKESDFSHLDVSFMEALDHVIYHSAHSAQAALTLLLKNRRHLTPPQLQTVQGHRRRYREISTRLEAFIEALREIYHFRRPPH